MSNRPTTTWFKCQIDILYQIDHRPTTIWFKCQTDMLKVRIHTAGLSKRGGARYFYPPKLVFGTS
jgi:hypothetical protein